MSTWLTQVMTRVLGGETNDFGTLGVVVSVTRCSWQALARLKLAQGLW